ncbi:hypothetical protein M9435_004951 [Picochlorum sp. BPE23]|nr:hypothetical protein M9435_004951 [Picochlorum sp. BPE23]
MKVVSTQKTAVAGVAMNVGSASRKQSLVSAYRRSGRIGAVRVFNIKDTEEVQDWRIKDMMTMTEKYFIDFVNKGDEAIADEIFDDNAVHMDLVWDPLHPCVGPEGLKHYLHDLKEAFPDFHVDIVDMATCDMNGLWVRYEGFASNLGEYHGHKPSHHTSTFSGVNMFRFTKDRTKITEVMVYRSAFAEDKEELREKVPEGGFRELRLRRLM